MSTPYIGFTSDQMDKNPELGPTAQCPKCGKECEIKESVPPMLQFISCCGGEYLVGIKGKDIQVPSRPHDLPRLPSYEVYI